MPALVLFGIFGLFLVWGKSGGSTLPELLLPQEPEKKHTLAFFFGDLIFLNF